ncbi:MAG: carboxypeptidase-like regulatory domain-containing protein [Planctomycetota bacterium]
MNQRVAIAIVAAGLVGVLLWMLMGSDPGTGGSQSATTDVAATGEPSEFTPLTAGETPTADALPAPETAASTIDLGAGSAGIEGTVYDPSGAPATDAPVTLYRTAFPTDVQQDGGTVIWQLFRGDTDSSELFDVVKRSAEVRADEAGQFEFAGLAPGSYVVAAQTAESLRTPGNGVVVVTDSVERSNININSGAIVHGQVLEPSGTPVPGAAVILEGLLMRRMQTGGDGFIPIEEMLLFAMNPLQREVTSDGSGEFQFVGLPQLDYRVSAGADPWATAEVVVNVPVDAEATLILAEAGILVGRVVDELGRGIAAAELSLRGQGGDRIMRWMDRRKPTETKTDSEGNFRVPRMASGPYSVEVEAPGFQDHEERVELAAGVEEFVEIRLATGGVLRGIVRGDDGKPVADVRVRARGNEGRQGRERGGRGRWGGGTRPETRTDADGLFLFDTLAPGEYQLEFRHDAWLPQEITAKTGDPRIEVALAQGESVRGRVVDVDGDPIADARISIRGEGRRARPRGGRSDAQGFFVVAGIQDAEQTIEVRARGFTNWESELAGTSDLGDIVLAPAVVLAGVVLDPDGKPLPGVRVRGQLDQGNQGIEFGRGGRGDRGRGGRGQRGWMGRRVTVSDTTDADGVFAVELPEPEGSWNLTARSSGLQEASSGPIAVRGADITDLVLQLQVGVILSGTVTGPSGEGIKGATVSLRSGRGRGGFGGFGGRRGGSATRTEADGTYQMTGVTPGEFTLRVTAEGYAQGEVRDLQLREGAPIIQDVRLERAKQLTGIVVTTDGVPIEGADLFVFGSGMNRRPSAVTSLADGTFVVEGLGDETVQVRASASGFSTATIEDVIAEESPLRVQLEQAYDVSGIVTDGETGDPVPGARVTANTSRSGEGRVNRRFGRGRKTARTDSGGAFVLKDLDAGDWTIEVTTDPYVPERVEVSVPESGNSVDVVLRPGGRIRGVLVSREGDPIQNVLVQVFDATTTEEAEAATAPGERPNPRRRNRSLVRERTDEDGSFVVEGVPSGTVRVTFQHDDYLPDELTDIEVEIGAAVPDLRHRLERGAQVTGRLREAGGSGMRYLRLTGGSPQVRKLKAIEVGESFTFSGLPAGSYTLRIQEDRRGRDVLSEATLELKDKQRLLFDAEVP